MDYKLTVVNSNGVDEEIDIIIDLDAFAECESNSEKIKYIKSLAKGNKVLFTIDDLKDLESDIKDQNNTSWAHPNETWDEFVEHEDFGM